MARSCMGNRGGGGDEEEEEEQEEDQKSVSCESIQFSDNGPFK